MSRKIVAIGGGENGRKKSDGTKYPYELKEMDKEIIKLTEKEYPNFLFLAHSQPLKAQEKYFQVMVDIYNKMYGCQCKNLKSDELTNIEKIKELIEWADIIYEGGGDTVNMIKLWKKTGFDKILKQAWDDGKVMCGVSAGANCWFDACSTDSLSIQNKDDSLPLTSYDCLGFIKGFFVPHCNEPKRIESSSRLLKEKNMIGFLISNCAALEIVDNQYRLITSDASYYGIEAYGKKAYWKNGQYVEENIDKSDEFKNVEDLYVI